MGAAASRRISTTRRRPDLDGSGYGDGLGWTAWTLMMALTMLRREVTAGCRARSWRAVTCSRPLGAGPNPSASALERGSTKTCERLVIFDDSASEYLCRISRWCPPNLSVEAAAPRMPEIPDLSVLPIHGTSTHPAVSGAQNSYSYRIPIRSFFFRFSICFRSRNLSPFKPGFLSTE